MGDPFSKHHGLIRSRTPPTLAGTENQVAHSCRKDTLYVELSEFKVARIREQEDGEDNAGDSAVHVTKIERSPRG